MVFITSGTTKILAFAQFQTDLAELHVSWPAGVAGLVVGFELLVAGLLVSKRIRLAVGLAALATVAFANISIWEWPYVARGCACFGGWDFVQGLARHRVLLAAMLGMLGFGVLDAVPPKLRNTTLLAGFIAAETVFAVMSHGLVSTTTVAARSIEAGSNASDTVLSTEIPILYVSWDCPHCTSLLAALRDQPDWGTTLPVVFTFPEWLDTATAAKTAYSKVESWGLASDRRFAFYLGRDFHFGGVPLLLVGLPREEGSKVVANPPSASFITQAMSPAFWFTDLLPAEDGSGKSTVESISS